MTSPIQRRHGRQHTCEPQWLRVFLAINFSGSCTEHEAPKNELKRYCIDCKVPACFHCVNDSSHTGHRILKVYRYSCKDAVLKSEIKEHMDCSKIQAYTCNGKPVLALNPFPHRGSKRNGKGTCDTCMRKLMDPTVNRYCSLVCKVEAFLKKENDSDAPFLEFQGPSQELRAKRSRKGVPQRASLW